MTVSELIEKLMGLDLDATVEIYHETYHGIFDEQFETPVILATKGHVVITDNIYTDYMIKNFDLIKLE